MPEMPISQKGTALKWVLIAAAVVVLIISVLLSAQPVSQPSVPNTGDYPTPASALPPPPPPSDSAANPPGPSELDAELENAGASLELLNDLNEQKTGAVDDTTGDLEILEKQFNNL